MLNSSSLNVTNFGVSLQSNILIVTSQPITLPKWALISFFTFFQLIGCNFPSLTIDCILLLSHAINLFASKSAGKTSAKGKLTFLLWELRFIKAMAASILSCFIFERYINQQVKAKRQCNNRKNIYTQKYENVGCSSTLQSRVCLQSLVCPHIFSQKLFFNYRFYKGY